MIWLYCYWLWTCCLSSVNKSVKTKTNYCWITFFLRIPRCSKILNLNVDANRNLLETIRLVASNASFEGRVEVFLDGFWGTVCDIQFGMPEANVVCWSLGYHGYVILSFSLWMRVLCRRLASCNGFCC